jgi:hypothetical protein
MINLEIMRIVLIVSLVIITAVVVSGCATKGVATRVTGNAAEGGPGNAWYIESKNTSSKLPYSCSFVEFDERGDYLNFAQQQDSWRKIEEIAKAHRMLLVVYCHGWKNSAQSGDVVSFVHFLGRLAASQEISTKGFRVHGLYLGWRGNQFRPYVDRNSEAFRDTKREFGGPIVDQKYARKYDWTLAIPETLTYWSRKGAAEAKVSGVPIARTIFEAASAAKQFSLPGSTNKVIVVGHSFGALMLEKAFGQASVGAITQEWPWRDMANVAPEKSIRSGLPVDCTLFINSAAPSLYAKELSDFMWANENARRGSNATVNAGSPLIISITSSADWATRVAHRWANVFAPLYPSLQRKYRDGVLKADPNKNPQFIAVPQAYFYEHTPGHNPLLVDHWIVKTTPTATTPPNDSQQILEANLSPPPVNESASVFYTSSKTNVVTWNIGRVPDPPNWSQYHGYSPVRRGNYWVIRCNGELIASHTAIWTENTMELYAALLRLTYANPPPK